DHDVLAGQLPGNAGLANDRFGAHSFEVVAVEGDVEGAAGHDRALVLLDRLGDPFGELDAAPLDADEHEIVGAMGELEHFYRHTRSEEHTSELQSPDHLVCRLLLEKKKKKRTTVKRRV